MRIGFRILKSTGSDIRFKNGMKEETKDYKITFNWKNIATVFFASLGFIGVFYLLLFFVGKVNNKDSAQSVVTPTPEINMEDLKKEDIVVGKGPEVKDGDTVSVNYKGTLTDGKEFDNSYKRGQPFEFKVGAGKVIKGWDLGLVGMKVGGKRKLTIPSALGYGERGAGTSIPPNSTLVFEVELLKIK